MNKEIVKRDPLWKVYQRMSKGHVEDRAVLIKLAGTMRSIDPKCPYGPHGILESIQKYGLKPGELAKLYRHCGADPLTMNAVDFAFYKKALPIDKLKAAIKDNFQNFDLSKYVAYARQNHRQFGQYYSPRTN